MVIGVGKAGQAIRARLNLPGASQQPAPPGTTPQPAGPGWRPVIPARVADAAIALGVAALGLASGLGGRSQGEHVPLAALPVLTVMGLVLYPRQRWPLAVLARVAALVGTLMLLATTLGGSFVAVLCAGYSAAVYSGQRAVMGLRAAAVAVFLLLGIPQAFGLGPALGRLVPVPTLLAAAGVVTVGLMIRSQLGQVTLAAGVAVATTLAAALVPAWRATRAAPVQALREAAPSPGGFSARRLAAGLVTTAAGAGLMLAGLLAGAALTVTAAGAALCFAGVTATEPLLACPLAAVAGYPLLWLPGRAGALAGLGLGAAVAYAATRAQQATVTVPWPQVAAYLVAGGAAGLLASAAPARRAARLNMLAAIASE